MTTPRPDPACRCGHPASDHDEGDWTCQRDDCECEEYTPRPTDLTEHTHPESMPPCPACERAARADAGRELAALREALEDLADGIENEGLRAKVRALAKESR